MTTLERWDESVRLLRMHWAAIANNYASENRVSDYWLIARDLIPLGLRTPHETAYGGEI